jgi:hypothetical protein
MNRTIALVALVLLAGGCTRFGTRANGPFSSKPRTNPQATIPPGPLANSSPLVLGTTLQPQPPGPPDENRVVPDRIPDPVALGNGFASPNGVVPAGGLLPEGDPQILPRRRPNPDSKLPSPFAPKGGMPPVPSVPMPKTPMPMAPAGGPPVAKGDLAEIKKLIQFAGEKWAKVDTYECTAIRRELTPTKEMSEDTTLYQYRKEPMAVFMRTLSNPGKGREIVYNPGKHGDKIYVMTGEGDTRLFKNGGFKAPPVSPDSDIVKEKSRYSIREAGHGTPIKRVGGWIEKVEAGKVPAENLKFLGPVERKEFSHALTGVELTLRPGDEPLMPNGGTRRWFFDTNPDSPACGFPVLIIATEPNGKEVEYYLIEKVKTNVKFGEMDFSPDRLGKK